MTVPDREGNGARSFDLADYGLYSLTVLAWGTNWLAVKWQVGVVAPSVSMVWRFSIAATIMIVWCLASGKPMRFPLRIHVRFAALGLFLFGANFILFYYAALYLVSGMLAVIFSLASITNILLARFLLGESFKARVAIGALVGSAGLVAMFWPEVAMFRSESATGTSGDNSALVGLAFGLAGVVSFSIGNMISADTQRQGTPILPSSAYGMVYGTLAGALFAIANGDAFVIELTAKYIGSLLWLAILATVIGFWAYLTLLGRIGPDRAGYATVLFPLVAMAISTAVEGYSWSLLAAFGVALVLMGNLLVLTRRKR